MENINLDNPIFTYYVNVGGMAPAKAQGILSEISNSFNYQNVTIWIVPIQQGDSRIDCVYDGRIRERSEELKSLIEELNEKASMATACMFRFRLLHNQTSFLGRLHPVLQD